MVSTLMAVSVHAHCKWPKWFKMWPNSHKLKFCNKLGVNLILDTI